MSRAPKALLFDLGGVIVQWRGIEALMKLTGLSRADIISILTASEIFQAYEKGRCSDDIFAAEMIERFSLDMSPAQFKPLWQSWVEQTYPNTKPILTALRERYVMACLSNINVLHWERLKQIISLEDYFDHSFASHLMQTAKPAPLSYEIPIEKLGISPCDIWFFDDTEVNIYAAEQAGLRAFHVDRKWGVIPTLKSLGLA